VESSLTLVGKAQKKLIGRALPEKAKKALKNAKKYLAMYSRKIDSLGNLPSGKPIDNLMLEVLKQTFCCHER
jgi:hypothetical protein